jgi:hypothetical protein
METVKPEDVEFYIRASAHIAKCAFCTHPSPGNDAFEEAIADHVSERDLVSCPREFQVFLSVLREIAELES